MIGWLRGVASILETRRVAPAALDASRTTTARIAWVAQGGPEQIRRRVPRDVAARIACLSNEQIDALPERGT